MLYTTTNILKHLVAGVNFFIGKHVLVNFNDAVLSFAKDNNRPGQMLCEVASVTFQYTGEKRDVLECVMVIKLPFPQFHTIHEEMGMCVDYRTIKIPHTDFCEEIKILM